MFKVYSNGAHLFIVLKLYALLYTSCVSVIRLLLSWFGLLNAT